MRFRSAPRVEVRRWALREQMSIREIARRTGLSRNTVKKYLRAGDEAPRYAKRASSSKLDPYADKLATWLAIEATKSRKQRRNLRQIHTHQALIHTVKPSGSQSGGSVFDGNLGSEIGGIQQSGQQNIRNRCVVP